MAVEDQIPDIVKRHAYHPSLFVYAWKRTNLEKLFEELMQSNIAIISGEVWMVQDDLIEKIIPLMGGQMEVFNWEIEWGTAEDWYDFVERSVKETTKLIEGWNLEKMVRPDIANFLLYNFKFAEE